MASFAVASGPCKGEYDGVVLSTDLEPDDAVAIMALAPRLRGVPLLVILGQGPVDKRQMAAGLLASLGLDEGATLVQGRRSTASWPDGVTSVYQVDSHKASVVEGEGDALVSERLSEFLSARAKPFALLLKPPHEFLGLADALAKKTVATIYGSFNYNELREGMKESDASMGPEAMDRAAEALLHSFKALLYVERSTSVGRDSVVDTSTAAAVWAALERMPPVMQHCLQWNADTLRSMGRKLGQVEGGVASALGGTSSAELGAAAAPLGPEQYAAVRSVVDSASKRLAVMASIVKSEGKQICHADTLVVACLLDDGGQLAPYCVDSRLTHDANHKPQFVAEPGSTLSALLAAAGAPRDDLNKKSFAVLSAAVIAFEKSRS